MTVYAIAAMVMGWRWVRLVTTWSGPSTASASANAGKGGTRLAQHTPASVPNPVPPLQSEIAQSRMIIGTAVGRPMEFPVTAGNR
jgi:hypothetical protein